MTEPTETVESTLEDRRRYGISEDFEPTVLLGNALMFGAAAPGQGQVMIMPVMELRTEDDERTAFLTLMNDKGHPGLMVPLNLKAMRGLSKCLGAFADAMEPKEVEEPT